MFEKNYFVQSQVSNYQDYRKRKFTALANDLINTLKLRKNTKILDFGSATGGLIKEFKEKGFTKIVGTDISYWAVDYGRKRFGLEKELQYYNVNLLTECFDFIFFLDVLEHVPTVEEIRQFLKLSNCDKIVVRLPVSQKEGEPYVLPVSRNDETHVQCHTKKWWINLFQTCGFFYEKPLYGDAIYDSEGVFAGVFITCK